MSEKKLKTDPYIQAILNGESALIAKIYEEYHRAIIQLVENNGGNTEDAKDVFQEGLMLIYQKASQPGFKLTSSFFTFFYAVCRNIWFNKRRKKSFGEVSLSDEMTSTIEDDSPEILEHNEQYTLYRNKFLELSADCQQLLSLFMKKVSLKEIAEVMGLSSIGYAKKKKYKCKERLVTLIQSDARYAELSI
jgi:RNA polymerase sigma factor (sigma-70 family)